MEDETVIPLRQRIIESFEKQKLKERLEPGVEKLDQYTYDRLQTEVNDPHSSMRLSLTGWVTALDTLAAINEDRIDRSAVIDRVVKDIGKYWGLRIDVVRQEFKNRTKAVDSTLFDVSTVDVVNAAKNMCEVLRNTCTKYNKIYFRGGDLVRVVISTSETREDKILVAPETALLRQVERDFLVNEASSTGVFKRTTKDGEVSAKVPASWAIQALINASRMGFQEITRMVVTPTLTRNHPGYDPTHKILAHFNELDFPNIPFDPTPQEIKDAHKALLLPISKFHFASPADKSVALSAMLCSIIRYALDTCPMHFFVAPTAGTGKTLMAQIIANMGMGRNAPTINMPANEEEMRKALVSLFSTSIPIVIMDNIPSGGEIDSAVLCAALTSTDITDRRLATNDIITVSTKALLIGTGNNIQIGGDLARRSLRCTILPDEENPYQRVFPFHPIRDIIQPNRSSFVGAILTVMRGYIAARGRGEGVVVPTMGDFTTYNIIRETLVWLGEADPIVTTDELTDTDHQKQDIIIIMNSLVNTYGGSRFTVAQIGGGSTPAEMSLRNTIIETLNLREWNSRSVGRWLARNLDRIISNRVITKDGILNGALTYRIRETKPGVGKD